MVTGLHLTGIGLADDVATNCDRNRLAGGYIELVGITLCRIIDQ